MARPNVDLSQALTSAEYWSNIDPLLDRPLTLWGPNAKLYDHRPISSFNGPPRETTRKDGWLFS